MLVAGNRKNMIFSLYGGENMNIADRLKELRKKAGYSQEQLAEMLNISRQAVSKWESAQGNPDIENLIKLTEIYNVSADYILSGQEKEEVPEPPEPKQTDKMQMYPEIRKALCIMAIIMATALSGALFIAMLSLITRYLS